MPEFSFYRLHPASVISSVLDEGGRRTTFTILTQYIFTIVHAYVQILRLNHTAIRSCAGLQSP
jgi:hypothetical protein